jgi:hypothetical protein
MHQVEVLEGTTSGHSSLGSEPTVLVPPEAEQTRLEIRNVERVVGEEVLHEGGNPFKSRRKEDEEVEEGKRTFPIPTCRKCAIPYCRPLKVQMARL